MNSDSKPHVRTRRDHSSETAEDYVEMIADVLAEKGICRLRDLAEGFGVSHVTVHRIIERLTNEGLVETEPYRPLFLTEKGQQLAKQSRERHQIVLDFLIALGVDQQTASIDAEGIEHHVSPVTLTCFQEFIRKSKKLRR